MNPQNQPVQPVQVNNPLSVMQPGERNIFEVRRHPFGMIGIYIAAGVMLTVLAIIVFAVLPTIFADNSAQVTSIGAIVLLVVLVLTGIFLAISHKVYWGNRWVLTSDSLTQVLQISLFDKQSSQLSLANLEDVTATQNGILPHMFNFGTVTAETAGERSKFVFVFCPNPTYYAQQILNAREQFEQSRREVESQPQPIAPNPNPQYAAPNPVQQ
jgi:uncharacterized membrane protein YdbT with pleckstrin-like domain